MTYMPEFPIGKVSARVLEVKQDFVHEPRETGLALSTLVSLRTLSNIAECVVGCYHEDTSNTSPTPYIESSGARFQGM